MAQEANQLYAVAGNKVSQQAEPSTANRGGGVIAIRTLVELQVISMLLHQALGSTENLAKLRQDVSDSIT